MARTPMNILFFFPDQWRSDWLGCNPDLDLHTPNLDRLAGRGVSFTHAMTPSPVCAPARACLASGLEFGKCKVWNNNQNYPLDIPTYYQALRDAGYRVAGVGKFDLHKPELDWNEDGSRMLEAWGFTDGIDNEGKGDGVEAYSRDPQKVGPYLAHLKTRGSAVAYTQHGIDWTKPYVTDLQDEEYCDNWLSENGLEIIRDIPAGTLWHMQINFAGPHSPFDVTERMRASVEGRTFPLPLRNETGQERAEYFQDVRRNYAAMIENIDRQIGRYLDLLEERDELENTLIVFASDHGEMLGDYDAFGKCIWHDASSRIPLIISAPGAQQGVVSNALVNLQDLTATFLDYAGVDSSAFACDGNSLSGILDGTEASVRDIVYSGLFFANTQWEMVWDGKEKLARRDDGFFHITRSTDGGEDQCQLSAPELPGNPRLSQAAKRMFRYAQDNEEMRARTLTR